MTQTSLEQVIFEAARQLPTADARRAYVAEQCADAPSLLLHLQALLKAYDEHASFLETPPVGLDRTDDFPVPGEQPGSFIGPYKLLQKIGEGGMGIVYMAEQISPVHRRVALKIIKPGLDSRQFIARFESERQALALMDHVNIARVFDAGATDSGRPYLVMELVNGVPITKYCDDNHLTPLERLQLFIPVCLAIQHAHQKGVIHRDIKPSNVMVTLYDGKPVPKVIDFGVAKAIDQKLTEKTLFTNFGTMVGTFEYMSPEQAEMSALGVDTRSDIYSLGVLLYELLTGSTPLNKHQARSAAYAELLRMIKNVEPPRPSTRLSKSGQALATISAQRKMEPAKLTRLVKGELDWIVMKTLEKDRNRRYESASSLADDIQQYLKQEPVKACPPSPFYRFRKFARRNKVVLFTSGFVGIALLFSTVDSLYLLTEANKARKLADERLQNETNARNLALAAVDRMLTRVCDETMSGVPQAEQVRLKLYQDAVEFYRNILKQRTDDPELRFETAMAFIRLGEMYIELGHPEQTYDLYVAAHKSLEELHAQSPDDPRFRVELAKYFNRLYWQAYLTEDMAKQYTQRSIDLVQPVVDSHSAEFEVRGERVRTTLADCLRAQVEYRVGGIHFYLNRSQFPNPDLDQEDQQIKKALLLCEDDSCRSLRARAYCLEQLSRNATVRGDPKKAVEYSHKAMELAHQYTRMESSSPTYRWELGCHYRTNAECLKAVGRYQEAERRFLEAVRIMEQLERDFPTSQTIPLQTEWVRMPLAQLYLDTKQFEKVIEQIDKIEHVRGSIGRIEFRPDDRVYVPGKLVSLMQSYHYRTRGLAHFHLKHYEQAQADIAKAVDLSPNDRRNVAWFDGELAANCLDDKFKNGMRQLAEQMTAQPNDRINTTRQTVENGKP